MSLCCMFLVIFFFQAEDGIRDGHVTGVQTCALPISGVPGSRTMTLTAGTDTNNDPARESRGAVVGVRWGGQFRSEERRVGKGCGGVSGREEVEQGERLEDEDSDESVEARTARVTNGG